MSEPMSARDYPAVRVHVESSDVPHPAPHWPRLRITVRTIVLTAAQPYNDLALEDPAREYILLQVFGNNAVLCTSYSQAQDPANQAAGLPNPNGCLLSTGLVIPIRATNRLWVAAAAFPTQISVIIAHKGD